MNLNIQNIYHAQINGKEVLTDDYFEAVNATTGVVLSKLSRCTSVEVNLAVEAATAAQLKWKQTSYEERSVLLNKLADALEQNLEHLATIDTADIGRKYNEIELDYKIAIEQFRYFAGAILTHEGFGRPNPNGYFIAKREPIGVVGQIIPWNVPAIMVALKVAPAIAAGNTVVLKPDENASLSTLEFGKIASSIFPEGVINILTGFGEEVGAAITAHPKISKLAFTGSPSVGRIIGIEGAKRLVPVSLELGGKSANIIFPDIDRIDDVVDNAVFAFLYCNGQSCLAGTRLFVHDDVYDVVIEKLVNAVSKIKVGNPFDPTVSLSSVINETQAKRILDYIQIGKDEGANLLTGGKKVEVEGHEYGWFIEPTIFEAKYDMRIAQEEIFGPVLSVMRWSDKDQLIAQANSTSYGLAAGIYTNNLANAFSMADSLEAGNIWINRYFNLNSGCPFGGYKESGIGREHCHDTLNMYSNTKTITIQNEVDAAWFIPK